MVPLYLLLNIFTAMTDIKPVQDTLIDESNYIFIFDLING